MDDKCKTGQVYSTKLKKCVIKKTNKAVRDTSLKQQDAYLEKKTGTARWNKMSPGHKQLLRDSMPIDSTKTKKKRGN